MSVFDPAAFAIRYTAAWCSHRAAAVANLYAPDGSLAINDAPAAIGRSAITESVQAFMTGYPDLVVRFDRLEPRGDRMLYHWSLTGTNTGPGGSGKPVRISGYEDWKISPDGLIAESKGHYDAREWERQVNIT